MLIRHPLPISASEITPEGVVRQRRELLQAGVGGAFALVASTFAQAQGAVPAVLTARPSPLSVMP